MSLRVRDQSEIRRLLSMVDGQPIPERLVQRFSETGALLRGHFLLQSGGHADFFLRTGQLLYRRDDGDLFAKELVHQLRAFDATKILCSEAAPKFLADRLAEHLSIEVCAIRVDRHRKPTRELASGKLGLGDRVLIVADFITTGASHGTIEEVVASYQATVVGSAALTVLRSDWVNEANRALFRAHWRISPIAECQACRAGTFLWPAYEFA